jgi:signal transduction histidine kinase
MFGRKSPLPPRNLIGLIVAITLAPLAVLLWLGWRLLEQDRILEGQQIQQQIERSADLVVAALQRALASSEQLLAAGSTQWPDGAVAITIREGRMEAYPHGRFAYLPVVPQLSEAPGSAFAQGEELEFRQHDPAAAITAFRELAKSSDPALRAGALLRLGRNLAESGRTDEALGAYAQLAAMDGVATAGVPAGLNGRYARCILLEKAGRGPELLVEARLLDQELQAGRWALTAPVYWLYAGDAARWTADRSSERHPGEIFAEAASVVWERQNSFPAAGRDSLAISGQTLALLWQKSDDTFRALIAGPAFVESQWLPAAAAAARDQRISFHLGETGNTNAGPQARRSALEAALPWSITVFSTDPDRQLGEFALRRRLLIAGFIVLVVMALAASYLIFRAVSRELAVARLQSDFVAAVSHEFRTPLTTLRQFTDMLRENQGITEERRHLCYEAQSRATDRLTKLVESLLDFGRMEAGARHYQFEPRDCTELVRRVVEDFRGEARASGYEVEFHGNGSAQIETDGEALARAVWNLLDNAVKYSPDHRAVEVDLSRREGTVCIAVRDHGIGIPAQERSAIFAKFQRGEQARTRGIKGTGIGLAMVDEIVKAHQGSVEVESEPGKGSTFTIVLPVKG